eukprot:87622_1
MSLLLQITLCLLIKDVVTEAIRTDMHIKNHANNFQTFPQNNHEDIETNMEWTTIARKFRVLQRRKSKTHMQFENISRKKAAIQAPCDIFASGGTPCVAAHSTVRALFGDFNGPLYQIKRAS